MSSPAVPVVAVVGPTAAGKSDLALALAVATGGEVVSADAFQLYRGMDVGTAKTPVAERRGVPHHLVDVLDLHEKATVAGFQRAARHAVDDCRSRGRVPVLVGGSALYVRAVVDRFDFPGTDPRLRAALELELAAKGAGALHARLAEVDPAAAAAILPTNGRRLVRALEVVGLTGRPFAATLPPPEHHYHPTVLLGLDVARDVLDARIAERVHRMWRRGFVAEVRELAARGLADSPTASRALGYAQVLAFLAGECGEKEAREDTIRATRRFARRQDAWFRKDQRICWLRHDDADLLDRALGVVDRARDGDR